MFETILIILIAFAFIPDYFIGNMYVLWMYCLWYHHFFNTLTYSQVLCVILCMCSIVYWMSFYFMYLCVFSIVVIKKTEENLGYMCFLYYCYSLSVLLCVFIFNLVKFNISTSLFVSGKWFLVNVFDFEITEVQPLKMSYCKII